MEIPIGFKFNPKDHEVITYLLHNINEERLPNSTDFIADAEVFKDSPPWELFEDYKDFSSITDNGIYFYSKVYKKGKVGIKNSIRIIGNHGSWRCESKPKNIKDPKNEGKILGIRREFSFKGDGGEKWLLSEYCLPEGTDKIYGDKTKFEYVICKLKEPILQSNTQEAAVHVVQQEKIQPIMQTDRNEQENIQPIMTTDQNEEEDILFAMQTDYNFTIEEFDRSFDFGAHTTQESTANSDYESIEDFDRSFDFGAYTTQESTANIDYELQFKEPFGVGSSHPYSNAVLPPSLSDFIIQLQTTGSGSNSGFYTGLMKSSCNSVFDNATDEDWMSILDEFL